jgi:succinoglycan biosynthesis protein ExoU
MSNAASPITPAPVENGRNRCVDVIIAAWNREDTIRRAAASALAEPEVRSVVVVDDGSTDETALRAKSADDGGGRLVVVRLPKNGGPAAARNIALRECSAPWITILDGDDYLLPGRMRRLLDLSRDWDFVADDILQIRDDPGASEAPRPMLAADGSFEPWRCDFTTFVLGNIPKKGRDRKELGFFKPLMRRSFLDRRGLCYDDALRLGEDYALYARALAAGARFRIVPACGYVSVIRPGSLSGSHSKQDLERLRDFDLVLADLPGLAGAELAAVRAHYASVDARVRWLEAIEAVKAKSVRRFLGAWLRSPKTAMYVSARLAEQIAERIVKQIEAFALIGKRWR